jgi:hypothetical protein
MTTPRLREIGPRPGVPRVDFEAAEQCLAHTLDNAVTRAYLRSTMIERRFPATAPCPLSIRRTAFGACRMERVGC